MSKGKLFSGIVALAIYFSIILLTLYFYNIHKTKAKNYVEKNLNRVTVTLVNSDKTVFNRSSKKSNNIKPIPHIIPPVNIKRPAKKVVPKKHNIKKDRVKKHIPKKVVPKKHNIKKDRVKKHIPKKVVPKKHNIKKDRVKKHIPKKVVPKKHNIKKDRVKKHIPKKVVPKKHNIKKDRVKKHIPKKVVPKKHNIKKDRVKKHIPKKVVPKKHNIKKDRVKKHIPKKVVPKKVVPKKTAKELFSSIKTKDVTKHRSREAKEIKRHIVVPRVSSRVKHNSSISDRIKNTHQSGRVSNQNSDRGIKNAYIAKVKRHMNNWNADSSYRGKYVSLSLTIYNSGKFSYKIIEGGDSSMRASLSQFLDRLNRMGQLGRHTKSSPYTIKVDFRVR